MPIGNIFGETIRLFRRHSTLVIALADLQILPQVVAALGQLGQLFLWAILSGVGFFALILLLLIPLCGLFIWAGVLAFLAMRLIFVPQIIVAEDANAFAAMSRSWELTRGSFWRVFGA